MAKQIKKKTSEKVEKPRFVDATGDVVATDMADAVFGYRQLLIRHFMTFGNLDIIKKQEDELEKGKLLGMLKMHAHKAVNNLYPADVEFEDIPQEYIPVIKPRYRSGYSKGIANGMMYAGLSYGDIIRHDKYIYGVLEVRHHGVVIKRSEKSSVMLLDWRDVYPVPLNKYYLYRMGFINKNFRAYITKQYCRFYSKRLWKDYWIHVNPSKGYVILNDSVIQHRFKFLHELQAFLFNITGEWTSKMFVPKDNCVPMMMHVTMRSPLNEGFLPNIISMLPTQYDNTYSFIQSYPSEYIKTRVLLKRFVTRNGTESFYHGLNQKKHDVNWIDKEMIQEEMRKFEEENYAPEDQALIEAEFKRIEEELVENIDAFF
jgi:hypothetical protein